MKSKITQLLMIKVTIIVATLFIAPNVQASIAGPNAAYIKGAGFVWEGDISAIINVDQNGIKKSTDFPINAGLFAITLDTMNSCISSSMFAISSDGKAKGIQLADDVIFVLNAAAEGNVWRFNNNNTWEYISGRVTFNDLSAPTSGYANITSDCPWDVGFRRSWTNKSDDIGYQPVYANISGIGRLYIGPKAKSGVVNFPEIYFMKGYVDSVYKYTTQVLIGSSQFNIVSLSCTISAPPVINFGIINRNTSISSGLLSAVQQGITVNCHSDYPDSQSSSTASITWNGTWKYTLSMNDLDGKKMGEIRGKYVSAMGTCAGDVDNELIFDGTGPKIVEFWAGRNEIPITWSLCKKAGDPEYLGEGFAQATVNVDWD